jgi:site-specific recombinase
VQRTDRAAAPARGHPGSSISLTHLLERLDQTLRRIRRLLHVLDPGEPGAAAQDRGGAVPRTGGRQRAAPWRPFAVAGEHKAASRSVTQQASETGEHYITGNRSEYLQMLRSGAGAGLIIAVMALIKIQIEAWGSALGPTRSG